MKLSSLLLISVGLVLSSCFTWPDPNDTFVAEVRGAFVPVYMTSAEASNVEILPPQAIAEAGKIYVFGNYLFVNDRYEGIHVINNQNPSNPQKLAFIKIPGNVDLAVKDNTLYADNILDLLVFDIQNPQDIRLVRRLENSLPSQDAPPANNTYFECVDPSKGVVVSWEYDENYQNPQCFN